VRDGLDLVDELAPVLDPTDAKALDAAPPTHARRAVRRWLTGAGYPPDAASVARVLAVARGSARACELAGGRRVERHHQRLRIVDAAAVVSPNGMGTSGIR
ncbi:MAG: TilS substrate-binding domain-containing protein, partial [Ilumatobacteraceae bacterium]